MSQPDAVLLVHGGAGTIDRAALTPERDAHYRDAIASALRAGYDALRAPGGSSLDAVEAAVRVLEDSPLFNAGRGSVFNREGRHELDAALMDGQGRRAGGVAGVRRVKNPISAARRVMERSGHVLLAGPGADLFAEAEGLELVDSDYFRTEARWDAYREALRVGGGGPPGLGTVGAVAADAAGNLAAASSTGGTTFKRAGRVGDTPVVGAGLYAENGVAAVACTGDGEAFLRIAAAHELIALVKHRGLSLADAAVRVVRDELPRVGGTGGLIALGADGSSALPFNTAGMYRGRVNVDGTIRVAIFEDDDAPGGL